MNIAFTEDKSSKLINVMAEYSSRFTGVTDDFLEHHLIATSLYRIAADGISIGYFTIYEGDKISSFYMDKSKLFLAQTAFRQILIDFKIKIAFAATCDELLLSLCLDNQKSLEMQAYFFEHGGSVVRPPEWDRAFLHLAKPDDVADILDKDDVVENIRLGKYYVMRKNGIFIGQGFFNHNRLNPDRVSIGMSVHPDHRRRGVGRSIIMHLTDICCELGLTPNCGCWYYNYNSKKTLESAGYITKTRLLNVHFTEEK